MFVSMSNMMLELFLVTQCSQQLRNSPRYKPGFGCTDGEVLERLWSYLRRFSRMTKEMRPSHRIDVLTDALLYYGRQAASNLSEWCGVTCNDGGCFDVYYNTDL